VGDFSPVLRGDFSPVLYLWHTIIKAMAHHTADLPGQRRIEELLDQLE
jgi:hypothetical protein